MSPLPISLGRLKRGAMRIAARARGADCNFFLGRISGVIHVGANLGQERDLYSARDLKVIWLEPIPEIFARLSESLKGYPKQRAYCRLVTDQDDRNYLFNVSSNQGESSSIFEMAGHTALWPEVSYTKSIPLKSVSLSTFIRQEGVDLAQYDALVMDTQGSELLVLRGAIDILRSFKFIKAEVADFEAYKGCCLLSGLDDFLQSHGFRRIAKAKFAKKKGVGAYYDVVYTRV